MVLLCICGISAKKLLFNLSIIDQCSTTFSSFFCLFCTKWKKMFQFKIYFLEQKQIFFLILLVEQLSYYWYIGNQQQQQYLYLSESVILPPGLLVVGPLLGDDLPLLLLHVVRTEVLNNCNRGEYSKVVTHWHARSRIERSNRADTHGPLTHSPCAYLLIGSREEFICGNCHKQGQGEEIIE